MKKGILTRSFPPEAIKQRQGQGGKMLSYLETHTVIARLNEGCDAWSFEVIEHQILDEEVIVVAKLTADGIVKMAFGGSSVTRDRDGRPISIADDLKAAGSDALKKAASLLGVGLELYGGGGAVPEGEQRGTVQRYQGPANPAPERPSDRLTQKQYAAVHSIARRQNIDRDRLTGMLEERFKKADLQDLSRGEASAFISEMTGSNGAHP